MRSPESRKRNREYMRTYRPEGYLAKRREWCAANRERVNEQQRAKYHAKKVLRPRPTPDQRFWAKVDRRGPDECWPWLGNRRPHSGHGRLWVNGRNVVASRIAYELAKGPLGDLWALHTCDNGWCCNPAHLYAGTHRDNVNDRMVRHRHHDVSGEAHPLAKLTWAAIRDIRARRVAGELLREIAARYDTTVGHIGEIVRGELWREKP